MLRRRGEGRVFAWMNCARGEKSRVEGSRPRLQMLLTKHAVAVRFHPRQEREYRDDEVFGGEEREDWRC